MNYSTTRGRSVRELKHMPVSALPASVRIMLLEHSRLMEEQCRLTQQIIELSEDITRAMEV